MCVLIICIDIAFIVVICIYRRRIIGIWLNFRKLFEIKSENRGERRFFWQLNSKNVFDAIDFR